MTLQELILSINKIEARPPVRQPIGGPVSHYEDQSGKPSVFDSQKMEEAQRFDALAVFDPNADVLWPGSIVQGDSMDKGVLSPIALARTPLKITLTNLTILPAQPGDQPLYSRNLNQPDHPTAQEAMQQLVTQAIAPDTPAKMSYSLKQFFSIDHALLQLGVSASWLSGNVKAQLEIQEIEKKSNYLVEFKQSYYTVSSDPLSSPSSFFAGSVTPDLAALYMGPDNPPMYVSSVTYGRILYFFVSSRDSALQVRTALDAAFRSGISSGSVRVVGELERVVQESDMRVLALGGSGSSAVDLILGDKVNGLGAYLRQGANFSLASPGVPISYQLRYLRDNDLARMSLTTEYDLNSVREQRVVAFHVNIRIEGDDKDREEALEFYASRGGESLSPTYSVGGGTKWLNGTYPNRFALSNQIPVTQARDIKVHMYKTPYGSATGNGMEAAIVGYYEIEDGRTFNLFDRVRQQYGDGKDYNLWLN